VVQEAEQRAVRGPSGKLQVKKVRESCWTARKRRLFFDHLAATGNATASAKAAGMHVRSAFALRQREPEVAALWDATLDTCQARLEAKLILYSETKGETKASEEGGEDELAGFDPKLALQTLALLRARPSRRQRRRGGPLPKTASREETEAAVLKLLKKLKRRIEKR
jgi:hypothetical protein